MQNNLEGIYFADWLNSLKHVTILQNNEVVL